MFERILKKFVTKGQKNEPDCSNLGTINCAPTTTTDHTNMDIIPFIRDIENLLNVECPRIQPVALLFGVYRLEYQVMALQEFRREDIPADAQFLAAHYIDNEDTILLSNTAVYYDYEHKKIHFNAATSAEHLFFLAHELRHVWQKKYAADKYYQNNANGMAVINDNAEIDADAFAFAYVFSDRTPFTNEDIPTISDMIVLTATSDYGKRWKRTEEFMTEYDLNSNAKLEELKSHVEKDKINFLSFKIKSGRI